jgi:uncharacterized protein
VGLHATAVMLGVENLDRSKKFYADLGCPIEQDYPNFVSIGLGENAPSLALYEWEAAAQDAGVSSEGSGFRGFSLHYIVDSNDAVDEIMAAAKAAGGEDVKPAEAAQWGGYYGYFADPDGYLWKVAAKQ